MKIFFFTLTSLLLSFHLHSQCQAGFTYSISTNGTDVDFKDASNYTGNVMHHWDFNNGQQNWGPTPPTVHFIYAMTYSVCLTISDSTSGCLSTFCDTVKITNAPNPPCWANFFTLRDTVAPYPVLFFTNGSKKNFWDFGDGSSDTTTNNQISHQFPSNSTYTVCHTAITVANDTCNWCTTVNSTPCHILLQDSFSYSIQQGTVNFTSHCSGASVPEYFWDFDDGSFLYNQINPTYTYQHNGQYTVCLTYTDTLEKCIKKYCQVILINNAASDPCVAMFTYHPDTVMSGLVHFSDHSSSNITSWTWSFPGGSPATSTSPSPDIYYPIGTHTAYLTVINASGISCTYQNTFSVGYPCKGMYAYFTLQPDTTSPNHWIINNLSHFPTSGIYTSCEWFWGDGSYSWGDTASHTYSHPGWYTISLYISDYFNCSASYIMHDSLFKYNTPNSIVHVNVINNTTTDIESFTEEDSGIMVYPNPSTGEFKVNSQTTAIYNIDIFNSFGQHILSYSNNEQKNTLTLSGYPNGVYWIKIKLREKSIVSKLVIIK